MATTLSPSGIYQIALGGPLAAHSAHRSIDIRAPDLSTAQTVAQSIATILGASVALIAHGNAEGASVYSPGSQGSTVSSPSGISLR